MLWRAFYLGICGIVFAGIVHIAVILLIPVLGERDAARQIMATSPEMTFQNVSEPSSSLISTADPFFDMSVCRFDVGEDGVFISADQLPEFWSASVYDERGAVVYSLNDRTAIANKLRVLIVNPVQMAAIRQLQPDELETSIIVETTAQKGFVLLRAFVRDPSLKDASKSFLASANCEEYKALSQS